MIRVVLCDRGAQFRQAERRRVVNAAVRDRALRRLDHRARRRKIRLADLHVNDASTGSLERARGRLHLHHMERGDLGNAGGEFGAGIHRKS